MMEEGARPAEAARGFSVFETAIGHCALAWTADGIAGSQLPDADEASTRSRMRARFPGAPEAEPPEHARRAIDTVRALLRGEPHDLAEIPLDMTRVPEFDRRVYAIAREIPGGTTLTYGEIATRLGEPGAARAVGRALGNNPFAPLVPCHRILAADGRMHGFSASGGVAVKLRMLRTEGWRADEPTLFES